MKLRLVKIKQHRDRTFELPDSGIVRIKGPSGTGKSTLFEAIRQFFYGDVRGITSWDETTSKVELDYLGLSGVRSNRPNVFKLAKEGRDFLDDEAEVEVLKTLDMSSEEFMASSYIQQEFADSLLTLSPGDQLRLIERLAFGSEDPGVTKVKIQAMIAQKQTAVKIQEAEVARLERDTAKAEAEVLSLPALGSEPKMTLAPAQAEQLGQQKKSAMSLMFSLKQEMADLQKLMQRPIYQLLEQLAQKKAAAAQIKASCEARALAAEETLMGTSDGPGLEYLKTLKTGFVSYREWFSVQKHVADAAKEVDESYPGRDRTMKLIDFIDSRLSILTGSTLEAERVALCQALADAEKAKTSLACPSCQVRLRYASGSLALHEHSAPPSAEEEARLKSLLAANEAARTAEIVAGAALLSWRKDLTTARDRLLALPKPQARTLEELEASIADVDKQIESASNAAAQRQMTLAIINQARKEMADIDTTVSTMESKIAASGPTESIEELRGRFEDRLKAMESAEASLAGINVATDLHNAELAKHVDWTWRMNGNLDVIGRKAKLVGELKDAAESMRALQTEATAALRLKEVSDVAALEAIAATFDAINSNAKQYLDAMFPETGTQVALRNKKELKSGDERAKPSLVIHHKGSIVSSFKELSGGERARIRLAFHLALSDLYASPLLLIDEPFQGIGGDDRELALDVIKSISDNKLVLIIEHNMDDSQADVIVEV